MICEIVTFPAVAGMSRDDLVEDARHVVARWRGEAELVRKHFVVSDDGSTLKGIYFWTSRAAAQNAHDEAWLQQAEKRIGVRPTIDYFDTFMIIDNEKDAVTEYPAEKVDAEAGA